MIVAGGGLGAWNWERPLRPHNLHAAFRGLESRGSDLRSRRSARKACFEQVDGGHADSTDQLVILSQDLAQVGRRLRWVYRRPSSWGRPSAACDTLMGRLDDGKQVVALSGRGLVHDPSRKDEIHPGGVLFNGFEAAVTSSCGDFEEMIDYPLECPEKGSAVVLPKPRPTHGLDKVAEPPVVLVGGLPGHPVADTVHIVENRHDGRQPTLPLHRRHLGRTWGSGVGAGPKRGTTRITRLLRRPLQNPHKTTLPFATLGWRSSALAFRPKTCSSPPGRAQPWTQKVAGELHHPVAKVVILSSTNRRVDFVWRFRGAMFYFRKPWPCICFSDQVLHIHRTLR
mmetsp:Transcript_16073/g.43518  ORF Transcript_16073/g.43518 Transcript_16073/m.43518 type:complete len:340 (-) Transcript_16073:2172-3191(-)